MVLSGNPWVESSSLECGDQINEVTWDVVQRVLVRAPVVDDQKWILRSAVPPPVASRDDCHGHQARAYMSVVTQDCHERGCRTFTAARWFLLVHFAVPFGTPSPVCRTDCPIRPLLSQLAFIGACERCSSLPTVDNVVVSTTRKQLAIRSP